MPGSDGSVVIKIDGDDSGFQEALGNVGTIAQKAGKVAAAAVAGTGTLLTAAAAAAVNVGMSFEASMSNVAALSGATGEELALLTDTAKEMGATTQFSATQAADALSYMALAGWDAQQSVDALPGVLDLAASSGMDLAAASDMVTDYLSAFGMEAKDSTYFADMLAYAQGNANTTATGLGEAYKNCAANMHAAGQDVETTTSLLSMLANQGLKGAEAGTTLAAVMRDLTAKMEDGAIKIGKTSVKVMDANGNYRDMTDILTDVESATKGMGDAEKAAALSSTFTSDSIKGLNMVLNAGVDEAAKFEEELRNSTGAASNMADTMNDNLKGRLTEMGSALEGVGIQCYEAMEGPLKKGVESATKSIGKLSDEMSNGKLRNSTEKIAEGFGKIVEKAGELTEKALPAVVNGFADVVDHSNEVVSVAGSVAAGYAGFKVATKYIQPLTKGWKAATTALEAHEAASRLTLVATYGGLTKAEMLVGVLTGKISLATAAQAAWNAVASANPYVLIGAAVAAAAVGIGLLIAAQKEEVPAYQEVVDSVYEEKEALDKLKESRDEAISSNLVEIDNAEALLYQYKQLADETGVVRAGTDEYARAKSLANRINAVAPGAIQDLEDEKGAYLQTCDAIDLLIAKKRAEAIADANQESYETAIQNRQQYVEKLNELDEQRKAALQELQDAQDAYTQWDSDYNEDRVDQARKAVNEINAAYDEQVQKVVDAEQTIASQEQLWEAMQSDSIEKVKDAINGYGNKVVEFTGQNADACMESAKRWEGYYNKLKELQDQGTINDDAWVESVRQTYEEQKAIADSARDAETAATDEHAADVKAAWGNVNSGILEKIKEIYPELEAAGGNLDAFYGDGIMANMAAGSDAARAMTLAAEMAAYIEANGATEAGQQFANGLLDGMIQNSGLPEDAAREVMQTCLDAAAETAEINSPSRVMIEQGMYLDQGLGNGIAENAGLATTPASTLMQNVLSVVQGGLVNLPIIGNLFSFLFGSGITGGAYAANGAASSVGVDAVSSAQASLSGMSNVGFSGSSLIGSGLLSNKGAATSAAQSVMTSAASSVNANTKIFSTAGKASMAAYASAIKSGGRQAVAAVQSVNKSSTAAIVAQKTLYTQSANVVMTAFNTGIKSRQPVITSTAKTVAKAGATGAGSTKPSYQSAGYNLSLGIAAGIRSGRSAVISAAVSTAKSAIAAAKSALGINSPSKVAENEIGQWYDKGWAHGITKYAYTIHDAISTVADDTFYKMQDAVYAQTARVSSALSGTDTRGVLISGGKIVNIDYHPEQKCDEPVSLRDMDAKNRQNARQIRRLVANA